MFAHCSSLISLNLSSFETPSLNQNYRMFYYCSALKALDMSNFNFTNANSIDEMFNGCGSLISLNLINFNIPSNIGINNIFGSNNKNLIYCVNNNSLYTQLVNNDILNNDCSNICFNYSSKIIIEKNKCIYNCYDDDEYKYEYNRRCYNLCPSGTHENLEFSNLCEKDGDENDENNDNIISIIENNTKISLSKSDSKDLDNIITYQIEELIIPNINEISNSDELIPNINDIKYNVIKIEDNEDMYHFIFTDNQNNNISHSNIRINITAIVGKQFEEGNFDELISNIIEKEGKDIKIQHKNTIIQLTTTDDQKKNQNNNISSINLGECETKLKLYNNISTLFIIKADEKGELTTKVDYKIYNKETKEQLNLTICGDTKIELTVPVYLKNSNLNKYDPNSEYYNDICFSNITENNLYMTIKKRRNIYINNNMSLCDNKCIFKKYNDTTKNALCECNIINMDKLLNSFKKLKNALNLNIMKCYYILFNKEGLKKI